MFRCRGSTWPHPREKRKNDFSAFNPDLEVEITDLGHQSSGSLRKYSARTGECRHHLPLDIQFLQCSRAPKPVFQKEFRPRCKIFWNQPQSRKFTQSADFVGFMKYGNEASF
jgi:hypothetical protein